MGEAAWVWLAWSTWALITGGTLLAVVGLALLWRSRFRRPQSPHPPGHLEQEREQEQRQQEHLEHERSSLRREREALLSRTERLDERERRLEADQDQISQQKADLDQRASELAASEADLVTAREELASTRESLAGLSREQARADLMKQVSVEAAAAADQVMRNVEAQAREGAEARAADIITTAIQRLAASTTSESVVSTVELPNDDMKGRIIGREGRNIRAFEQLTGVDLMIDDTPGLVLVSSFDPVRREVARSSLADLVSDGRINLASIEAAVERNSAQVQQRMDQAAHEALDEMRITDLDPHLVPFLGALHFRTSYGQNVLAHLLECGHLATLMAAELGLDEALCRRAAFLHDIGKAVTHEAEGSHAMVGAQLARRYGEDEQVVHAIEAHHNEVEPRTPVAVLTQAADTISASRPGARRQSLEAYVERLERLEQVAARSEGVERVFAMQAGREVRVMVSPAVVDDASTQRLAAEIARAVQEELTYPGEVKVTVIRELRASEVAH